MKIAYFGGDLFCDCLEWLLNQGHEVEWLYTDPIRDGEFDLTQRTRKLAKQHNVIVRRTKPTLKDIESLQADNCEMIFSAGYPFKIPVWEGASIRYGVNIHPSLLPVGKGPMPLPHIILRELDETGVTLHKLSPDWDGGDVLCQQSFEVTPTSNMHELWQKARIAAVDALANFMQNPQERWSAATVQVLQDDDYWAVPEKGFALNYQKPVNIVEKYLRIHHYVNPQGEKEYVADVTFWKEFHSHAPGTVILEHEGLYIIAANDGFVKFTLVKEAYNQ